MLVCCLLVLPSVNALNICHQQAFIQAALCILLSKNRIESLLLRKTVPNIHATLCKDPTTCFYCTAYGRQHSETNKYTVYPLKVVSCYKGKTYMLLWPEKIILISLSCWVAELRLAMSRLLSRVDCENCAHVVCHLLQRKKRELEQAKSFEIVSVFVVPVLSIVASVSRRNVSEKESEEHSTNEVWESM